MYLRESLLDGIIQDLIELDTDETEYEPNPELIEEEEEIAKAKFYVKKRKDEKHRVLVSSQVAEIALEENLIEMAQAAGDLCVKHEWNVHKDIELIIAQARAHYVLAECFVELLLEEEIEIGFEETITIEED